MRGRGGGRGGLALRARGARQRRHIVDLPGSVEVAMVVAMVRGFRAGEGGWVQIKTIRVFEGRWRVILESRWAMGDTYLRGCSSVSNTRRLGTSEKLDVSCMFPAWVLEGLWQSQICLQLVYIGRLVGSVGDLERNIYNCYVRCMYSMYR